MLFGIKAFAQKSTMEKLSDFVQNWVGRPYSYGGDSERGIDCSAFVQRLYKDVYDFMIPRTCYYQYKFTKKIDLDSIEIGDILFFKSRLSPSGWHAGIYLGNYEFIHAANRKEGVKISSLGDPYYKGKVKGVGRVKL